MCYVFDQQRLDAVPLTRFVKSFPASSAYTRVAPIERPTHQRGRHSLHRGQMQETSDLPKEAGEEKR